MRWEPCPVASFSIRCETAFLVVWWVSVLLLPHSAIIGPWRKAARACCSAQQGRESLKVCDSWELGNKAV